MASPVNVDDFRELARQRLPRMVFDYMEGGAESESGLRHNRDVFEGVRFAPRRLVDISRRAIDTTLFGKPLRAPLLIAPTGLNGILWPHGDIVLARAAERFGIPFILSTASNASIEDVARAAGGDLWFQLYVVHRRLAERMVKRALDAGYSTLVLTTDVGVNGKRERDLRNGFGVPVRYTPRTLLDGVRHPRWSVDLLRHGVPQLANFVSSDANDPELQAALMSRQMDASFSWDDLARLRDLWPHRLLVKGLSRVDDAQRCEAMGIDGVILSNHGGRQLDGAIAPFEVLPSTRRAVKMPVLIDSGIRRGADVVKAVASGASAVLIGRATLYGLAALGGQGVDAVLELFRDEIDRTLAQIGCASVAELDASYLWAS
ncbi:MULTISPECIES: alpha-hydroxy-acid oxidizing protein [Pandoraea]|uniref:FMN-dependent dehydrogenase n=1 Tax=Pandoraea capi TaxID=2508286 RepID=A0ABY6W4T4_9BURK|nr:MULTISPECIES: alpha-hydroxy-acid oxidizing protein [Pandoraea]MCI3208686.1 mandelate dehydrogenase [Pandoraea sp. LA3]MDN4586715.1 mandelate dehydrogenase [Pandoraea capi]VVE26678.1 FMN-dependent dehydrogenase [Pandoraea capi]